MATSHSVRRERRQSEFIGLADAADVAGVNYRTVRRWIAAGHLPATRVGPKLLKIRRSDLDKFMGGAA